MKFRFWILLAATLFLAGLLWGLFTPPAQASDALEGEVTALAQLSKFILSLPTPLVFLFIYIKNVLSVVFSFVLSPFFCLVPVAALLLNGGLVGVVSVSVVQKKSLGYLLAGILPHGVIEVPALIIGQAACLSFGTALILSLFNKSTRDSLMPTFKQDVKYLGLSAVLLLPAAFIEAYITPLFVR
jgi:stage II sporulation protein M